LHGTLTLPMFREIVPSGLSYGAHYVVEFETDSLWYETSVTVAADALRSGVKVDYHTFQHSPDKVREDLARLGLEVKRVEEDATFRILDTYAAATGAFTVPEETEKTGPGGSFWAGSVKISDWSRGNVHDIKGEVPEASKRRLHIDDNTSILLRYNEENEIVDYWRTRVVPWAVNLGLAMVHAFPTGVASQAFYKHLESLCEGIFDLKSQEESGKVEHHLRLRTIRGKSHDSRWRRLDLSDNGKVMLGAILPKARELGLGGWLKGPKK
jgi:KaiC/GvpD/RAD55 family RecA-like ATPase